MRVIHKAWVVAFLIVSGGVHAGDIYVCKGAGGVNSYQNTPCATAASELHHSTYDASLGRPAPPPSYSADNGGQGDGYSSPSHEVYSEPRSTAHAVTETPMGYRCSAGQRSWVQKTPCPASYGSSDFVQINGHLTDGTMVRGTGFLPSEKPVQQQTLGRDDFCDQVRSGARIGQGGGSDASQSYERNKLKRNLCGG